MSDFEKDLGDGKNTGKLRLVKKTQFAVSKAEEDLFHSIPGNALRCEQRIAVLTQEDIDVVHSEIRFGTRHESEYLRTRTKENNVGALVDFFAAKVCLNSTNNGVNSLLKVRGKILDGTSSLDPQHALSDYRTLVRNNVEYNFGPIRDLKEARTFPDSYWLLIRESRRSQTDPGSFKCAEIAVPVSEIKCEEGQLKQLVERWHFEKGAYQTLHTAFQRAVDNEAIGGSFLGESISAPVGIHADRWALALVEMTRTKLEKILKGVERV